MVSSVTRSSIIFTTYMWHFDDESITS